jgi:lipopolysaccharide/colanic/teichoic acid biosynthesis glycosyltransferase
LNNPSSASISLDPQSAGVSMRGLPAPAQLVDTSRLTCGWQLVAKRLLDVVVASVLVLVLLPLLLAIAVLVRFSSEGPILFRQQRVGRDGRLFTLYKFRTMVHGSDPSAHRAYTRALISGEALATVGTYKLSDDPRITGIGRPLRRSSLDELPQLFNVLQGTMSLVGPRPALPYEVELYSPSDCQRLSATPGMTGLSQVRGRAALRFHESIAWDRAYVDNWSLWLDLKIIWQTPRAVLSGRGAC